MVQVLNETTNQWVAVCDVGFTDVEATVLCRNIGFKSGKAQSGSSFGAKLTLYTPIQVVDVSCKPGETNFSRCAFNMGRDVVCPSNNYVSVLCSRQDPLVEGTYLHSYKISLFNTLISCITIMIDVGDNLVFLFLNLDTYTLGYFFTT